MNSKRGFTLLEGLLTVAALGIIAGIAISSMGNLVGSSKNQKLSSDVDSLNRSVQAYLVSGGSLGPNSTARDVLNALKSSVASGAQLPGLTGAKLDPRLNFTMQSDEEAGGTGPRVIWDASARRFVLSHSGGPGIKGFFLDDSLAEVDYGEQDASFAFKYASEDNWVWDYVETPPSYADGPSTVMTTPVANTPAAASTPGTPPSTGPSGPLASTPLDPPTVSRPGGTYSISDYSLSVSLANPNPSGVSEIFYSIDYGEWKRYSGALAISPDNVLTAQAIPIASGYSSSPRIDHAYAARPLQLEVPLISPSRDSFGLFSDRRIQVTLIDPNAPGLATLQYRVNGDPWQDYSGPFSVDRNDYPLGATIQARAVSNDPYYLSSTSTLRSLGIEAAAIDGLVEGKFSRPTGDSGMVTNLNGNSSKSYFEWGSTEGGTAGGVTLSKSWLDFNGLAFTTTATGTRFEVGSLDYFNGTILSGTGANSVSLAVDLNLDIQGYRGNHAFHFDLDLINVANANDPNDLWADADYVKLANAVASEKVVLNGIEFQFQLEFGETTTDGISYFDEFHVLEGRDASTKLYGTLVEVGSVDFNTSP